MTVESLYSVSTAAEALGLSYDNTLKWVARGRLKARLVGKSYVIEQADLDAFKRWRETDPRVQAALRGLNRTDDDNDSNERG